ncbi:MAG: deoxyribodipyrimidine photo-lyase [Bacteroidales bacterium]|nr:MAG: deoxyribodipyrimidine photo-lyase [Bacteroidales bacterium]
MKISIFWFRRDLRLEDNTALYHALISGFPVLTVFIFDQNILKGLPADDPRISFIYNRLKEIHKILMKRKSSLLCLNGSPLKVWEKLIGKYEIAGLYINKDYEPYSLERDLRIKGLLEKKGISVHTFKDQLIFEENEIMKDNGEPYTVYTPYKKKWLRYFRTELPAPYKDHDLNNYYRCDYAFPELSDIGFKQSSIKVKDYNLSELDSYHLTRDFPARDSTSYLGPHLRFGTVSIRQVISQLDPVNETFLSELIWREFFMQILYHFPEVINQNFKSQYNSIEWMNNEEEFEKWCNGNTGYGFVDSGMRQLNITGYMHNRVRMVAASFLCKHLLIDWRWGEAYFAKKLMDYELSSNNGNWQWAAGTGCDAAPYFRIFNPEEQQKKFDNELAYIKKWVPEYATKDYPDPMVSHSYARKRALEAYKYGLQKNKIKTNNY